MFRKPRNMLVCTHRIDDAFDIFPKENHLQTFRNRTATYLHVLSLVLLFCTRLAHEPQHLRGEMLRGYLQVTGDMVPRQLADEIN